MVAATTSFRGAVTVSRKLASLARAGARGNGTSADDCCKGRRVVVVAGQAGEVNLLGKGSKAAAAIRARSLLRRAVGGGWVVGRAVGGTRRAISAGRGVVALRGRGTLVVVVVLVALPGLNGSVEEAVWAEAGLVVPLDVVPERLVRLGDLEAGVPPLGDLLGEVALEETRDIGIAVKELGNRLAIWLAAIYKGAPGKLTSWASASSSILSWVRHLIGSVSSNS